ncbi:diguanylate cyclase [Candidatus Omnitrophota bacterium]
MLEENWAYRIIVILSMCIFLIWTYLTNEATILGYINGKFALDARLIWQIGIFALLSVVLFYLMQSTLDYKSQNEVLKKYMQRLQQELDTETEALKNLKAESNAELLRLESFIVTISDMAKQISSVLQTDELLRVIFRKAIDLLGSQKCAIFRVDSEENELLLVDSVGYKNEEIQNLGLKPSEEYGLIGYAAQAGLFASRKMLIHDQAKRHIMNNDKLDAEFCQPIMHGNSTFAVLCVGSVGGDLTHEQMMRILSALANFGKVALTNTMLVDRIREQSIRDSLTWLYNHQYFQERMEALLSKAKAEAESLGLIIIDIDHFKDINDTYGHQAGDYILKKTAEILNSQLRTDDLIARYGGEEFVIGLPGGGTKTAHETAERIRKIFEDTDFKFEDDIIKVTISAGIHAFDPESKEDLNKTKLIKFADQALYIAKGKGRNKTIIFNNKDTKEG